MFEKYDAYKDSGIQWIGRIPEHWEIEKAKWIFLKADRPIRPNDGIVTCFRDGEVTLRSNRRTDGFTNALKEHGYQGIRKGDLVIHAMDAFAGAIGVSDSDGKSTPVYSACIPRIKNRINVHYYAYYLRNLALAGFIESLAKGIRERSTDFRFADFAELLLPFPKLEDQERIVAFLNQKTERKQIVIQKAVTQGLDPNVLMKDSGVEWIGQIPEKWKLMRLKFLLSEINVRSETGDETLLSLSKYKGVIPKDALDERAGGASTLVGYKKVFKDNLVINKMQAVNGLLAVSELEGITSPDYSVYSAKDNSVSIHYITFLLNQPEYLAEMKKRVTGVMEGFIRLYTDDLFDIKVLLPSYAEQLKIVQYINTVIKQVEEATSNLVQQIEKLKEYKTTLINDAVTGKIKVA